MTVRRKVIYGVIYVGIAVTFPALPLGGIKLIVGIFTGAVQGAYTGGTEYVKREAKQHISDSLDEAKKHLWDTLNPFN